MVTRTHPDGVTGAVAVAVGAALAAVLRLIPPGLVCQGIEVARTLVDSASVEAAVQQLGNGSWRAATERLPEWAGLTV